MSAFLRRALRGCAAAVLCVSAVSCGGGGGGSSSSGTGSVPPASNVATVSVLPGPNNDSINVLYTTVTVCLQGTSTCQSIDNIQVDTGSYGLRILASALSASMTFPVTKLSNGSALLQCTVFVDGYSWGPVAVADVQVGGETASSVPIQLIGDSRYPTVPSQCSGTGTSENTVAAFGANGILGIGPFVQDCGSVCVTQVPSPAIYYACTTESNCTGTTVPVASQVQNPVTLFAADNNGSIISLPSVPAGGTSTITGSLIFGIDTESNNASGTESVVPIDPNTGYLTTIFNGSTLTNSFIDSGSNGYYFDDSNLPMCTQSGFSSFYCPSSTTSLSAQLQLASGTVTVNFEIGNAQQITDNEYAFSGLGGSASSSNSFDWGLPFFYGRRVATAIQGHTTSAGTGPYVAF